MTNRPINARAQMANVIAPYCMLYDEPLGKWLINYAKRFSFEKSHPDYPTLDDLGASDAFKLAMSKIVADKPELCNEFLGEFGAGLTVDDAQLFAHMATLFFHKTQFLAASPYIRENTNAKYFMVAALMHAAKHRVYTGASLETMALLHKRTVEEEQLQQNEKYTNNMQAINLSLMQMGFKEIHGFTVSSSLQKLIAQSVFGDIWVTLYIDEEIKPVNIISDILLQRPAFVGSDSHPQVSVNVPTGML